jgi:muramoyltetrapeptide carboxypeptidase
VLRGGNLAVLAALCGTPLQPRFRDALVLLEDLSEPPYRLDRLVTQLLLSGALEGARGFVVGDLVGAGEPSAGRAEAVAERLGALGVPVAFGAPFGHAGRNQPVALGVPHALDATAGTLTPLEAPCARPLPAA